MRSEVTVTFKDAGHILGSAQVVLDINENGKKFRYLFSGDIGRGGDDILRDPEKVENVDYLQVESTYGGRVHSPKTNAKEEVERLVRDRRSMAGQYQPDRSQPETGILHHAKEWISTAAMDVTGRVRFSRGGILCR